MMRLYREESYASFAKRQVADFRAWLGVVGNRIILVRTQGADPHALAGQEPGIAE